jgi:ATP-dependent DNA ligase
LRCELFTCWKRATRGALARLGRIDFTTRFPTIAYGLAQLPTKRVIIDAELVAATAKGLPDFNALLRRSAKPEDIC